MQTDLYDRMSKVERRQTIHTWALALIVVLLLVQLALCGKARGQDVASELKAAYDHAKTLDPAVAQYTRYLTLYAVAPEDRMEAVKAISYVANHISRSPIIVLPKRINDTLISLNLVSLAPDPRDFKEFNRTYEKLRDAEPYWNLQTEVAEKIAPAVVKDAAGNKVVQPGVAVKTKKVTVDGGWIGLETATALKLVTHSNVPLLRGDWFLAQAVVPPFYYDFAGVPATFDALQKQLGIKDFDIKNRSANLSAKLIRSGVTNNFRDLSRWPSIDGAGWFTFDNRLNVANKDIFRDPLGYDFDATEQIYTQPNGTHLFVLFNQKGERQDVVPPDIAVDFSVQPPVELQPMLSCVRCHDRLITKDPAKMANGYLDFSDQYAALFALKPDGKTRGAKARVDFDNPSIAAHIAAIHSNQGRLREQLRRDRDDYAAAVWKATGGLTCAEASNAMAKVFDRFARELVTPAQAALELGVIPTLDPEPALRARFEGTHDPILILLSQGVSVQRAQWESSFQEASLLAVSNTPAQRAKP